MLDCDLDTARCDMRRATVHDWAGRAGLVVSLAFARVQLLGLNTSSKPGLSAPGQAASTLALLGKQYRLMAVSSRLD